MKNIQNLKQREKNQLLRLAGKNRAIPAESAVSYAYAQKLCNLSHQLKKQIGILVDLRGKIVSVLLGDHQSILLPKLNGKDRLRNYRFIHTHLKQEPLDQEDLYDLVLLQMDATTVVTFDSNGKPREFQSAILASESPNGYILQPKLKFEQIHLDDFQETLALHKRKNSKKMRQIQIHANRALLVGVYTKELLSQRNSSIEESLAELKELTETAGIHVVGSLTQHRSQLDPIYLLGKGKVKEMAWQAVTLGAEMIIFDLEINSAQAKRIAEISDLKIIDRTQIILDIFQKHARSKDGKIQVELAQLQYAKQRLNERDDRRSRLVGRIGTRGPGETSMEIGRRRIQEKIHRLDKELSQISKRRRLNRQVRSNNLPAVAVVGYTNAGKSTLLNALTLSSVKTGSALFVTLDPSSRRLRFPDNREVIIIDTVGFTRELPPVLSGAFRAILEEIKEADLLLHLIDLSDPHHQKKTIAIEKIIESLGINSQPQIRVYNKIDQLEQKNHWQNKQDDVYISAKKNVGLDHLLKKIERKLLESQLNP